MDRPVAEFARMVVAVGRSAGADAIVCVTDDGVLFREVHDLAEAMRVVAATPSRRTSEVLRATGADVVYLPARILSKFRQAQHAVSMAAHDGKIISGEMIACAVGHDGSGEGGDLVLLMDVDPNAVDIAVHELVKLTDGIKPDVLEAAIAVACRIGQASHRGRRIGAMLALGDSENVLADSRQLVFNPFRDRDEKERMLTDPAIHGMLVELSKLDGAFVVRGDGLIRTAGTFLTPGSALISLPPGLGTRHATAAKVSARTRATVVTVSAGDGNVRIFSHGEVVLQMDPSVEFPPAPRPQPVEQEPGLSNRGLSATGRSDLHPSGDCGDTGRKQEDR